MGGIAQDSLYLRLWHAYSTDQQTRQISQVRPRPQLAAEDSRAIPKGTDRLEQGYQGAIWLAERQTATERSSLEATKNKVGTIRFSICERCWQRRNAIQTRRVARQCYCLNSLTGYEWGEQSVLGRRQIVRALRCSFQQRDQEHSIETRQRTLPRLWHSSWSQKRSQEAEYPSHRSRQTQYDSRESHRSLRALSPEAALESAKRGWRSDWLNSSRAVPAIHLLPMHKGGDV